MQDLLYVGNQLEQDEKIHELSPAQEAIWIGHQLDPSSPTYNIASYVVIEGSLDILSFEKAVRNAVKEVQTLNMHYSEHRTQNNVVPIQLFKPNENWLLPIIDMRANTDPFATAQTWMEKNLAEPFDLEQGFIFRQALLQTADMQFMWYFQCHHIALDGYGLAMFLQRTATLYSAMIKQLTPPVCPFSSLAPLLESENAYRNSTTFIEDKNYWIKQLTNMSSAVSFVEENALPSPTFLRHDTSLNKEVLHQLETFAKRCQAQWPEIFIAALAAYLYRTTGSREIILGLPVLSRLGSVAAKVPTTIANVLPLCLLLRPDMTIKELVLQVIQQLKQLKKHQRYRAEDLRRDLNLLKENRRLTGPQINIDLFSPILNLAGNSAVLHHVSSGPVEDFAITIRPPTLTDELPIQFTANPKLYTRDDIVAHQKRFFTFLDNLIKDEMRPVGQLMVFNIMETGATQSQLEFTPENTTLAQLFENQVVRTPDQTAIVYETEKISYNELNKRANQLARLLLQHDVQVGSIVALALPRSIELIIAILAVIKTGATYLPLDITHPMKRIKGILQDTKPTVFITLDDISSWFTDIKIPKIILDDPQLKNKLDHLSINNLQKADHKQAPNITDIAYIIYTSGSTGAPKGVKIPQSNVIRLFAATKDWFQFNSDDVWTLFHSCAFDFSVWEIWGALLHGGRLVVVSTNVAKSPPEFLKLLVEQKVTVLNQVPSAFYQLIKAEEDDMALGAKLALRYIIFGGEALELSRLRTWYQRHSVQMPLLINMYGITETTVHVTYQPLYPNIISTSGSMIGIPIPDQTVYVLDETLSPVAIGSVGEMYIGGAGIASGYLRRETLNAQRFVADPFGKPGSRMYRSGDFARLHANGQLEYMGRADQQVKVRGFRIELGEIENVLRQHFAVREAVVLLRTDNNGHQNLTAFLVPIEKYTLTQFPLQDLQDYLRAHLPIYMVPAALIVLDQLPLSPNGKVDRKELSKRNITLQLKRAIVPARDFIDSLFIEIWQSLLHLTDVSIEDNFFDVGGDSFKAVQAARMMGMPVIELFNNPTLMACADYIRHRQQDGQQPEHQWLHNFSNSVNAEISLIAIPYGGGNAIVYQELAKQLSDQFNCWAVNLPGHDLSDLPSKLISFEDSVNGCVAAIKANVPEPIALYGHCAGNALLLAVARRLEQEGVRLLGIHIGAMIPDSDPEQLLERVKNRSGEDLLQYLRSIGGFEQTLSATEYTQLTSIAQHDSLLAAEFFYQNRQEVVSLQTPFQIIVGEKDPVTAHYQIGFSAWRRFSKHIELAIIPEAGHYFIKPQAKQVAQLLTQFHQTQNSNYSTPNELKNNKTILTKLAGIPQRNTTISNPFDDEEINFFILKNNHDQYSLWPAFVPFPSGWIIFYGPCSRKQCLEQIVKTGESNFAN